MRPEITRLAHEASAKSQKDAKLRNHPEAASRPPWPAVRPRGADPVRPAPKPRPEGQEEPRGPKLITPKNGFGENWGSI